MGPSMIVDGDRLCDGEVRRESESRFNGAVDDSRRRRASPTSAAALGRCFNGAVDDRRRRRARPSSHGERIDCMLQWGRRRSSTETKRAAEAAGTGERFNGAVDDSRRRHRANAPSAARGARFNGAVDESRRRRVDRETRAVEHECFNGAVDDRRRRPAQMAVLAAHALRASMGPSTIVDGDRDNMLAKGVTGALQWGRRRSSTETRARPAARIPSEASMGPSTFVDGDVVQLAKRLRGLRASMGPSTIVDGDARTGSSAGHAGELQWGRRRSSTETRSGVELARRTS